MVTKIVLDTNVLISALGWEGPPRSIFQKIIDGVFELILSYKQLEELERVLNYTKFKFSEDDKNRFLTIIYSIATIVETHNGLNIIKEDPSDNIILESALENEVSFLISGDKHLLDIKEFVSIKILTPREFLNFIGE